ncbi:sporulation protein [Psychromonas sp. RZ22]|uniref:SPOR domain-containing protein n=1 Tax=Psychromonas algarum TaxID=2555643 RepID=UPI00106815F6|nr:SPOR domain-containing protein [Psychromonas sp. RZ22]TEW55207.1 sporulation protein [Psychromonas sp. RZ22]
MASQFKNRLVGITILVALVVIFLPSLIDGEKTSYQQEFVGTPIKPNLKEHSKSFPDNDGIKNDQMVIEDATDANDQTATTTEWKVEEIADTVDIDDQPKTAKVVQAPKVTKPVIKEKKSSFNDPAWTIQLGAFQNKANINVLLKKLKKAGFQVHTSPREVVDGQLTRVFVGPDVSKKKLEANLPRLKRLTNLNGKLVPFNPIEP